MKVRTSHEKEPAFIFFALPAVDRPLRHRPLVLILGYSLTDAHSHLTLQNFAAFFSGGTFLRMMANSFWYALLITFFCLLVSYPATWL